jgi:hypothetical protein
MHPCFSAFQMWEIYLSPFPYIKNWYWRVTLVKFNFHSFSTFHTLTAKISTSAATATYKMLCPLKHCTHTHAPHKLQLLISTWLWDTSAASCYLALWHSATIIEYNQTYIPKTSLRYAFLNDILPHSSAINSLALPYNS